MLRNPKVFVGLKRYSPCRVFHDMIDDHGHHFISYAPFGLEIKQAIFPYFFPLLFSELEVMLIENDHFELIS